MQSVKMERRKREIRSRNRKRRAFLGMMVLFVLMLLLLFLQNIGRAEQDVSFGNPLERISSLEELNDKTREAAELFLRIAEEEGLPVLITETYRTQERQEYLYEQGRSRPGQVVTWTKNSNHTKRNAFDIAKNVPGEEYSDLEFFRRCAEIGREIGLSPGYYWEEGKRDMPHFEMKRFGRVQYPEGYERTP